MSTGRLVSIIMNLSWTVRLLASVIDFLDSTFLLFSFSSWTYHISENINWSSDVYNYEFVVDCSATGFRDRLHRFHIFTLFVFFLDLAHHVVVT